MKAKDIKTGEHYRLESYTAYGFKLLVDEVRKIEKRKGWGGRFYGGDTRVFGRIVDPITGKTSHGSTLGYSLSKVIEPWDEERYLKIRRAQEAQRDLDAEDTMQAELIIAALARNGCHAEFQLSRGITIPRSSMGVLLDLIKVPTERIK